MCQITSKTLIFLSLALYFTTMLKQYMHTIHVIHFKNNLTTYETLFDQPDIITILKKTTE